MKKTKASDNVHKWEFRARFRARAFGWRSQPAITRIKEAVSEIKKVARADPVLGAEGAVLFLERISPALEQVDSSSGAIGAAVGRAIGALLPIIVEAPATETLREQWLERLWTAFQEDDMPYIESIVDEWGVLCVTRERASRWADQLLPPLRMSWGDQPGLRGFFGGTPACLSCLLEAGRYDELLTLLESAPFVTWYNRKYGVRALAALGRIDEAIAYAEASVGRNDSIEAMAATCEEILLKAGRAEEAYRRFAHLANQHGTGLATFQALARKYPSRGKATILEDLVAGTPGEEGRWFATATRLGLYERALELAGHSPCDPRTLNRAARDHVEKKPRFALEAALLALKWLAAGTAYEMSGQDVLEAVGYAQKSARALGLEAAANARMRAIAAPGTGCDPMVTAILNRHVG